MEISHARRDVTPNEKNEVNMYSVFVFILYLYHIISEHNQTKPNQTKQVMNHRVKSINQPYDISFFF